MARLKRQSAPEQNEALGSEGKEFLEKPAKPDLIRININLTPAAKAALDDICTITGRNYTEAIKGALGTERAVQKYVNTKNASIFIEVPGEPMKELIFP